MHRATIKEMYFFKNKPIEFIKYAAQYLKMEKLLNQGYLYKEGDVLDRVFFIVKGTICLSIGKGKFYRELKELNKSKLNNNINYYYILIYFLTLDEHFGENDYTLNGLKLSKVSKNQEVTPYEIAYDIKIKSRKCQLLAIEHKVSKLIKKIN